MALKNDNALVQMHLVSGNSQLLHRSLPGATESSPIPVLRIMQRMRLEPQQLDGVGRRMQVKKIKRKFISFLRSYPFLSVLIRYFTVCFIFLAQRRTLRSRRFALRPRSEPYNSTIVNFKHGVHNLFATEASRGNRKYYPGGCDPGKKFDS